MGENGPCAALLALAAALKYLANSIPDAGAHPLQGETFGELASALRDISESIKGAGELISASLDDVATAIKETK